MTEATTSQQAAKRALRREVMARLRARKPEARRRDSGAIQERLFALEAFRRARGVHCYLSLPEEVDTAAVLARCQAEGKAVYVPYQIPGESRLGTARWTPGLPLSAGPLGVREPAPDARSEVALREAARAIDLAILPGVAFDRTGGRLGHGKGYYDRFLAELDAARAGKGQARGRVVRVAMVFPLQIVPEVPIEAWDIPMDFVLTPLESIDTAQAFG